MKPDHLPFLFGAILVIELASAFGLADYRPTSLDAVMGWAFALAASLDAKRSRQ